MFEMNSLPLTQDRREMTGHYRRVKAFRQRIEDLKGEKGEKLPASPVCPSIQQRKLDARLILEEVFETIQRGLGLRIVVETVPLGIADIQLEASGRGWDPVQLLDGVCDSRVVLTQALISAGLVDRKAQKLVDAANLTKTDSEAGATFQNGKLMKPPGFVPPDIDGEVRRQLAGGEL